MEHEEAALRIVEIGRELHRRGWALGTSGNFSIVTQRSPLRLSITASGADKGRLAPEDVLSIDGDGTVRGGRGRPSAEARLHLATIQTRDAGAVLHTHSVWGTLLSAARASEGALVLEDWEMLKGLSGVTSHSHREEIPILANSQDYDALAAQVRQTLAARPGAHAFLLSGHGLYTWGADVEEARRHVEVIEFLLEVAARSLSWPS